MREDRRCTAEGNYEHDVEGRRTDHDDDDDIENQQQEREHHIGDVGQNRIAPAAPVPGRQARVLHRPRRPSASQVSEKITTVRAP